MVGPQPTLLFHLAQKHNLWYTAIALLRIQAMRAEAQRAENRGRGGGTGGDRDGSIDPIQVGYAARLLALNLCDCQVFARLSALDLVWLEDRTLFSVQGCLQPCVFIVC